MPMTGHSHSLEFTPPNRNICFFPQFSGLKCPRPSALSAREFMLKNSSHSGEKPIHIRTHLVRGNIFNNMHPLASMTEFFGVNLNEISVRKPSNEYGGIFRNSVVFWDGDYKQLVVY